MDEIPAFQSYSHDPGLASRKRPDISGALAPHFGDKTKSYALSRLLDEHFFPELRLLFPLPEGEQ